MVVSLIVVHPHSINSISLKEFALKIVEKNIKKIAANKFTINAKKSIDIKNGEKAKRKSGVVAIDHEPGVSDIFVGLEQVSNVGDFDGQPIRFCLFHLHILLCPFYYIVRSE